MSDVLKFLNGQINAEGQSIINVADPSNPQDVSTKNYVDNVRSIPLNVVGAGGVNSTLQVTNGGTGLSSTGTIDQILGVSHTTPGLLEYKTITGTGNQVIVGYAAGLITISTPQDIGTGSTPRFANIEIDGFIKFGQISTPANPPVNFDYMYFKSDDNLYFLNSSGVEKTVGTVDGPATSTDNAVATWNGTGGIVLRNSDLIYSSDILHNSDTTVGAGTAGVALTVRASNQTVSAGTASGGALLVQAGSATGGSSTGNGGALTLAGGTSVGGTAGSVFLKVAGANAVQVDPSAQLIMLASSGANHIWNTDGGGDIGASGASRPNNLWLKAAASVGTTLTMAAASSANIIWSTDGSGDIGASGATRPNNFFLKLAATIGTSLVTGTTLTSGTSTSVGTTLNMTAASGANVLWTTDGSGDIGASGATRPNNLYVKLSGTFGSSVSVGTTLTMAAASGANILWSTDGSGDIGASGATRPNNFFLKLAATIGTSLVTGTTLTSGTSTSVGTTLNMTAASGANILWTTDGSGDIGASGATRPNNLFLKAAATIGTIINMGAASSANILWTTDGSGDVGASGATRPNNVWAKTKLDSAGTINLSAASGANITWTTDGAGDIGASGASRPNNLFLKAAATIGSAVSVGTTLTMAAASGANIIWSTDGSGDIGASGATRPNNLYVKLSGTFGSSASVGTVINMTAASSANILWTTDGSGDVGASGATRPNNVWAKTKLDSAGTVNLSAASSANVTWTTDGAGTIGLVAGSRPSTIYLQTSVVSSLHQGYDQTGAVVSTTMRGGDSTNNAGGALLVRGGNQAGSGVNAAGGTVTIQGGTAGTAGGNAGDVVLAGGTGSSNPVHGSVVIDLDITAGASTNAFNPTVRGANQTVTSGTGSGSTLTIIAGSATGATSTGNGGNLVLAAGTTIGGTAGTILFQTSGTSRWRIDTSGNFVTFTDGVGDIGQSGATRPNNLYVKLTGTFGTTLAVGTSATVGTTLTMTGGAGANITWSTDGGGDIGASGANRPNNFFLKLAATIGTSLVTGTTLTSGTTTNVGTILNMTAASSANVLWTTDGSGDIGASGATRPNNFFLKAAATIGTSLITGTSLTSGTTTNVGTTLNMSAASNANMLWTTDGSGNIGASGANRPNSLFLSAAATIGTTLSVGTSATIGTIIRTGDGTVAAPAHSFTNQTGSGLWYANGSGYIALSYNGTEALAMSAANVRLGGGLNLTFNTDGSGNIGGATGTQRPNIIYSTGYVQTGNGTLTNPSFSFTGNTNGGIYNNSGSSYAALVYSGVEIASWGVNFVIRGASGAANINWATPNGGAIGANGTPLYVRAGDGTLSLPSFAFNSNNNSGIYNRTASGYAAGVYSGVEIFSWGVNLVVQGTAALHWATDGASNLGESGASRPNNIFAVTNIQAGAGTVAAPSFNFSNGSTSGFSNISNTSIVTSLSGVEWLRVNSNGIQTGADDATVNSSAAVATTHRGANKTGGAGTSGAGGALTIQAGSATGASSTGNGGDLTLAGGTTIGGTAGSVILKTAATNAVKVDATAQLIMLATSGANFIWNTDGGGDIGASGATRPNNLFLKAAATVGTTLTMAASSNANITWSTDGAGSIGAVAASRPANVYFTTSAQGPLYQGADTTAGAGTNAGSTTMRGSNQTVNSATGNAGTLLLQAGSATGTSSTGNGGALTLAGGTTVGGTAGVVNLQTANTNRWQVTAAGHLLAVADNSYDIGASAATRPRNIFTAGYHNFAQIATPSAPAASTDDVYFKSDDNMYMENSAGTEFLLSVLAKSQAQNLVIASPNGSSGLPTFRQIVSGDVNSGAATSGQVLTANGSGAATWQTGSGGGSTFTVTNLSANYSVLTGDSGVIFNCDTTSASFSLTLPTPTSGLYYRIKDAKGNFETNNLNIIAPNSSTVKIEGVTTYITKNANAASTSSTITVATGGTYITTGGSIFAHAATYTYTAYNSGTGVFSGVSPNPLTGGVVSGDTVYQTQRQLQTNWGFYTIYTDGTDWFLA